MTAASWSLQRAYGSLIYPQKGVKEPVAPITYALKIEADFRDALMAAITGATRTPLSGIVLKMTDGREHPLRDLIMKVAFGQTRTPLAAVIEIAMRLAVCTDRRPGSSLLVTAVEEFGPRHRVSLYVFPEEESYTIRSLGAEATEALVEKLTSFVLKSHLRKVARFEGKEIKSHFLQGQVADFQIGSDPRTAADYWVEAFLEAEFAVNEEKGTRSVADGLKKAFEKADADGKQSVMEAATALVASGRSVWSMDKIANDLIPSELRAAFLSVVKNEDARKEKFNLGKALLKERINYRVFRLDTGVWVSTPFGEMGKSVKLERAASGKRILTARGVVRSEKVQKDAPRSRED